MEVHRTAAYRGWDAHWLERGRLALVVVPQVGGRVMGVRWRDFEVSFVNPDLAGRVEDASAANDVRVVKRGRGFLLWGGEKTWLAPQDRWTDALPFYDLDSGRYDVSVDLDPPSVRVTSPICRETGVQLERTIALGSAEGTWTVEHAMTNRGLAPVSWGLWIVSMVSRSARVHLPVAAGSSFPDGVKTFANEGDSCVVRDDVVTRNDGYATIVCREARKYKYGVDAATASALACIEREGAGVVAHRMSVPAFHPRP